MKLLGMGQGALLEAEKQFSWPNQRRLFVLPNVEKRSQSETSQTAAALSIRTPSISLLSLPQRRSLWMYELLHSIYLSFLLYLPPIFSTLPPPYFFVFRYYKHLYISIQISSSNFSSVLHLINTLSWRYRKSTRETTLSLSNFFCILVQE